MQKALVFCVSCALAWVGPALAQLRDSTVTGVRGATCEVVSQLPGLGSLRWEASLQGGRPSSRLIVRRSGLGRGEAQVVVNLTTRAELIKQCELYGADGQEIAVVHLMPEVPSRGVDSGVFALACAVRLLPNLEHVRTLTTTNQTPYGAYRVPQDYYDHDMRVGGPITRTNLHVVPYAGSLFASYEVVKRARDRPGYFVAGRYIESLMREQLALPPPWWMDESWAADVLPLGPSQPGPSYPILAPADGRSSISGVVLAPPWRVFPPSMLILNARIFTPQGIKRAHGLLARDLSQARRWDRVLKDKWILLYQQRRYSEGGTWLQPGELVRPFQWSEESRRRFGPVRLTVVASNEYTLIGTIERECPNPLDPDLVPGKDVWIFRIAMDKEPPLWIDTEQVQSCTLIQLGGTKAGWVDRTFDNGQLTVVRQDDTPVGVKAVLRQAIPVRFDGRAHKFDLAAQAVDDRYAQPYLDRIREFEPDHAEVTYLLDTADKQAPTDQP